MFNAASHGFNHKFNEEIKNELVLARIDVITNPMSEGEVKTTYTGKLGDFTFTRNWRYWVVNGRLPLLIARELYSDPLGEQDVRAGGHGSGPHPDTEASIPTHILDKLKEVTGFPKELPDPSDDIAWAKAVQSGKELDKLMQEEREHFLNEDWSVNTYHIDSLAGLRLFADTIRKYKLC